MYGFPDGLPAISITYQKVKPLSGLSFYLIHNQATTKQRFKIAWWSPKLA